MRFPELIIPNFAPDNQKLNLLRLGVPFKFRGRTILYLFPRFKTLVSVVSTNIQQILDVHNFLLKGHLTIAGLFYAQLLCFLYFFTVFNPVYYHIYTPIYQYTLVYSYLYLYGFLRISSNFNTFYYYYFNFNITYLFYYNYSYFIKKNIYTTYIYKKKVFLPLLASLARPIAVLPGPPRVCYASSPSRPIFFAFSLDFSQKPHILISRGKLPRYLITGVTRNQVTQQQNL